MNVIDTTAMTRDEWLALRRQSIGASDAPVIAGLSKYKSRFQLWLEKTGQGEPDEAGEEAWWGTNLEEIIEARLLRTGRITGDRKVQVMVRDKNIPWMTSTLDLVEDGHKVWEFKAAGIHAARNLVDGDPSTLSPSWILQAQHQMMCAAVHEINFAVFVGHRLQLYQFKVEWSNELGEGVLQLEHEFRKHVDDRTPPTEFDPQDAAVLLRHYRQVDDDIIVSDDEVLRAHAWDYDRHTRAAKFHAEVADQCKASLLARMQTAAAMRCGRYLMKRSTVDVKASTPKPREASSYMKFTFTNTESDQ